MDDRELDARLTKIESMLTYLVSLEQEYEEEESEELNQNDDNSGITRKNVKAKEHNE